MASNLNYNPDTGQPRRSVPLDPEAGRTIGTQAGVSSAPGETAALPGYGWLAGYLLPERGKVAYGEGYQTAAPLFYFEHEPPAKQAEEANPAEPAGITSAPVAGSEQELYKLNGLAYQPRSKPYPPAPNPPTTQQIVQTQASLPADLLPSGEDAMLALLTDF